MALPMLPRPVVYVIQPVAIGMLLGHGWHGFHEGTTISKVLSVAVFVVGIITTEVLCRRSPLGRSALQRNLFWMCCTVTGGLQAIAQIRLRVGKFKANNDALVFNSVFSSICLGASVPHVLGKLAVTPNAEVVLPFLLTLLLTEAISNNAAWPLLRIGVSVLLLLAGLHGISTNVDGFPGALANKQPEGSQPDRNVDTVQPSEPTHEAFFPATVVRSRRYSPNFLVSRRSKVIGAVDTEPLVHLVDRAMEAAPNSGASRRANRDNRTRKLRVSSPRGEGGSEDAEEKNEDLAKTDCQDEQAASDCDAHAVEKDDAEDEADWDADAKDALLNGVPCSTDDVVERQSSSSDGGGGEDSEAAPEIHGSETADIEPRSDEIQQPQGAEDATVRTGDESGEAGAAKGPTRHKGLDFVERPADQVLAALMACSIDDDDDEMGAPALQMTAPVMSDKVAQVPLSLSRDAFQGRLRPEAQTFEPGVIPAAAEGADTAVISPDTSLEPQPADDVTHTAQPAQYAAGIMEDGPFQEMRASEKIADWGTNDRWPDMPAAAWGQSNAAGGGANGNNWDKYAAQDWHYGGHSSMSGSYFGSYPYGVAEHPGALSADAPVFVPGQGHGPWGSVEDSSQHRPLLGQEGVASLVDPAVPDPGPGRASQVRRGDAGFENSAAAWGPHGADDPQASVLCVGDVEEWMTDAYITEIFAHMAYVTNITRLAGGYAYVQLDSPASAVYVMDMLGGGPIQSSSGHVLRVNWADAGYDGDTSWQATGDPVPGSAEVGVRASSKEGAFCQ